MSFEISSRVSKRKVGDVVVINLKGRMGLDREQFAVLRLVLDELEAGHKFFLIDLQEVEFIDSSGIGELFAIIHKVKKEEGTTRLLHLDDEVGKVLYMVQLHQMVETFNNEKKAFASFG